MLYYTVSKFAFDNGRGTGRACRYWKNRNYQRPWQGPWYDGVRVQLFGANGLQIYWQYLQGEFGLVTIILTQNGVTNAPFSIHTVPEANCSNFDSKLLITLRAFKGILAILNWNS